MKAITTFKPTTRFAGLTLLLAAAFGSFLGLATAQAEGLAEKAGQQIDRAADKAGQAADSTGEYMDDSAITAKVKWAILRDPDLKTLEISVATTGGVMLGAGLILASFADSLLMFTLSFAVIGGAEAGQTVSVQTQGPLPRRRGSEGGHLAWPPYQSPTARPT